MSFNIGPTLAEWLDEAQPNTLKQMIEADRDQMAACGSGNALAQSYNHTILPLASERDKRIQIAWGISDFVARFGRQPRGMWLPETACDRSTLATLRAMGIEFTILAPWQAEAAQREIDTSEPYRIPLDNGTDIAVFFYNSALSGDVSFNGDATSDATRFTASHLPTHVQREKVQRDEPQILVIATDGEVYGHHKPFRDMFLSHLLAVDAQKYGFAPISLEHYLTLYPPTKTTTIIDGTAWSCHHGIARWHTGCGCTDGDSRWKAPFRAALMLLAAAIDAETDAALSRLVRSPALAIENYMAVRLGSQTKMQFMATQATHSLTPDEQTLLWAVLDAQLARQAMFTSCAFFFDDLDRIEPRIAIGQAYYAATSVHAATGSLALPRALNRFVADLALVRSGQTGTSGAHLYAEVLRRSQVAA